MHAYRKYRVAISLAADQVRLIDSYRVARRHAYNWSVGRIMSGDAVSEYGLYKELTAVRREQEWMRAAPVWIQRAGIQDACTAHKLAARFGGGLRHRTRGHESQVPARSLSRSGMEKERQSTGVVFGRAADYGMPS